MSVAADLRDLRDRLPQRSVRFRLTLLYGSLFLVSGAGLLAINYILVKHQYTSSFFGSIVTGKSTPALSDTTFVGPPPEFGITNQQLVTGARNTSTAA